MKFKSVYSARYEDRVIRDFFFEKKYPQKQCDFCNSSNVYFVDEEKTKLRCKDCWKRSSLTHSTYLESTKLSLRFWYEVIWSFVLDHPSSKTKKLLRASNHQTILRIYRKIRRALLGVSRRRMNGHRDVDSPEEDIPSDQELRRTVGEYVAGLDGENHPIYGIYDHDQELTLRLLRPLGDRGNFEQPTGSLAGVNDGKLVGVGCLFHGKGEYLSESTSVQLEGLWNFTKSHMQLYQGVRRENWIYYLKEIEYKYNSRDKPYEDQVEEIVGYLMVPLEE